MNKFMAICGLLLLAACGAQGESSSNEPADSTEGWTDKAPYAAVADANAPTVRSLEQSGYGRVEFYPVGCTISGQPQANCDAIGAQFMDRPGTDHYDLDKLESNYDKYAFVCPAIEGVELEDWKCRKQG